MVEVGKVIGKVRGKVVSGLEVVKWAGGMLGLKRACALSPCESCLGGSSPRHLCRRDG